MYIWLRSSAGISSKRVLLNFRVRDADVRRSGLWYSLGLLRLGPKVTWYAVIVRISSLFNDLEQCLLVVDRGSSRERGDFGSGKLFGGGKITDFGK